MLVPYDRMWVGPANSSLRPYYRSYEDATNWPGPLSGWTPSRTVPFTTKAELDTAISGLLDGDYVHYTGTGVLTISSSTSNGYNFTSAKLSVATKAVLDFGSYYNSNHVKFNCTSSGLYGAYMNKVTNIWFVGGEYTSNAGAMLLQGMQGGGLIDAVTHGAGGGGVFICTDTGFNVNNVWCRWESFGNNQNPAADPHSDGGGGYHEGLIMDSGVAGDFSNNTFMCYGHDSQIGSCIQFGDAHSATTQSSNTFYMKAANNTWSGTPAGEIAQGFVSWGAGQQANNIAELVQVSNYSGRATYCASLTTASPGPCVTIKHGRATNTNQDTTDLAAHDGTLGATVVWDSRKPALLVHQDCVTV